ncbi:MAG TPA: hypothetical protein VKU89_08950 [Solirubrobacteraceae bacterium]|nr:hypothetical protein [Solirubrobacteraceae bacterium]
MAATDIESTESNLLVDCETELEGTAPMSLGVAETVQSGTASQLGVDASTLRATPYGASAGRHTLEPLCERSTTGSGVAASCAAILACASGT